MKSLLISTSEQEKLIQHETERRRTLRLLQTRQIEKQRAAQLRQTIAHEKKKQTFLLINQLKEEWTQQKAELHENLEYQFRENLMEMGKGHKEAADQPDYEHQWLKKTLENDAKANERGEQALEKLHFDQMQNENERNLHLLHRKAALELEKVRAQRIAKLPPPEDPLRDLQTKPTTIVTVHDPYNFTTSRYHLEERLVTKEDAEGQGDAAEDAIIEQERVDAFISDKQRLWNEQQEKARVRGDNALKREVLDNAYDHVLNELSKLERQDRDRRQKEIQNLPKSIFIPPWRREEEKEEKQRQMETAFEQVYQENHRKEPIPIVLMNEDEIPDEDEEENASDRTLVAATNGIDDEKDDHQPEYRMATITPSANTKPEFDEMQEDDEATLADPTIVTLQTPAPDQQMLKQQQQQDNMKRLMEKIERQRIAAQQRHQQQALITPTNKTPKKVFVSPGYEESSSTIDSSLHQQEKRIDEQTSSNTSIAEIEGRRSQLEARKQAIEEQIRLLSERANLLPSTTLVRTGSSASSSDLSIDSLLRNLRPQSYPNSLPSSSSSIFAGKHHEEEHEKFVQAVQAIVTSDESQLSSDQSSTSSSSIAVKEDERSHPSMSEESNRDRLLFDKYESHSSEDRDHSLEDLIARLLASQQKQQQQEQQQISLQPLIDVPHPHQELIPTTTTTTPMIIDDLVDDVLSSISSLSMNSSDDQTSMSKDNLHHVILQRTSEIVAEMTRDHHDDQYFYEQKRLIEQELELIRRERENLLKQNENHRQQPIIPSGVKTPQHQSFAAPPPPPSLLRSKINLMATNEVHELSTIQEVDTPVSSRNTSVFHHRSPLKSSFDLQQLERISSADSSSSSSSMLDHRVLLNPPAPVPQQQQQQQQQPITGLERDDSGISLIDGPRSSATSRTTLAGGNGSASGAGGGKSSSSGIQSLITNARQPRVRTITNETNTTTNTSISANMPLIITTPRSTDSDDQSISSVSKKWRDILANECLPQLPQSSLFNPSPPTQQEQQVLTSSLGFPSPQIDSIQSPIESLVASITTRRNLPNEEQILRSQYRNDECDLMSLMKVHEYLTKQQPTSLSAVALNEPLIPPSSSSSSTPPLHHQSYSTLTSVTYRSSLAKQTMPSGPPISTPSRTSYVSSPSDIVVQPGLNDDPDRRNSLISGIHHLTHSPNTFETSITSQSSTTSHRQQDTLSYLIEQNQKAMQRLIAADQYPTPPIESTTAGTTFFSSVSMRHPEYESGTLMTTVPPNQASSNEDIPAKTTLIETGSLSTLDIPSVILHAEDLHQDDRGILDEPSMTLLSNSYRSLTTSTAQNPTVATVKSQSNSQATQKVKKQCSSPISTGLDKTSSCSTPSLSPIKNEIFIHHEPPNGNHSFTPVFSALALNQDHSSPSLKSSTTTSASLSHPLSSGKKPAANQQVDSSLLSFEQHELSAGNATLTSNEDQEDFQALEKYLPLELPKTTTTTATLAPSNDTDWAYYITVGQGMDQNALKKPSPPSSTSSTSSSSSDDEPVQAGSNAQQHTGGLEFFIAGSTDPSAAQIVQLPSLQTALQTRRADFLATSQKRVDEIKGKDYSTVNSLVASRSKPAKPTSIPVRVSASSNVVETDPEERQRRARESKERSKRLYEQLPEVQQKKKFHESKQQAQAYRARMNAFQTTLDQKKKTPQGTKKPFNE